MANAAKLLRIVGWLTVGFSALDLVYTSLHTAWSFAHAPAGPESKARILAEGISETMLVSFFLIPGALLLATSAVLSRRARRAKSSPERARASAPLDASR